MRINAVVVTYNRLDLLKECIEALRRQTMRLHKIFVVDNCSTDATPDYLRGLADDEQFVVVSLPVNMGGAGGFSEGIKQAVLGGCDWVWVMDDDTIPSSTALEELAMPAQEIEHVGLLCSRVTWMDGKPHKMNLPDFDAHHAQGLPMNYFADCADVLLIRSCSFVSALVKAEVVYEVGLPIKEFFIWSDDTEYTLRIHEKGYRCLYANRSVVLHKTKENYFSNIRNAPVETLWKFRYGCRNMTYLRHKRQKGIVFYISVWNAYRRMARRLKKRRLPGTRQYLKEIRRGFWEGLTFRPRIEYLPPRSGK